MHICSLRHTSKAATYIHKYIYVTKIRTNSTNKFCGANFSLTQFVTSSILSMDFYFILTCQYTMLNTFQNEISCLSLLTLKVKRQLIMNSDHKKLHLYFQYFISLKIIFIGNRSILNQLKKRRIFYYIGHLREIVSIILYV